MQNESTASQMKLNRRCLVKIVDTLQFLARQGLALRGDNSEWRWFKLYTKPKTSCERHSDINGLDETKAKQIYEPRYSKKIIQTMANQITSHIAANIGNNFYSIISDKYREISNKKQLSFCIHWVDKFFVTHKEFLEFYEVPNIKSETLIRITKDILLRFQLSLKLCRGQCFDGTSNMLGKRSGVAIQIYKEQQRDTHAHCHSLNLSIKDVTRSS